MERCTYSAAPNRTLLTCHKLSDEFPCRLFCALAYSLMMGSHCLVGHFLDVMHHMDNMTVVEQLEQNWWLLPQWWM